MEKNKESQENLTLKKIRYYQGSIQDFENFWNDKIKENEPEISDETKSFKQKNDDLNKAFEIVPVTADDEKPELTPEEKEEIKKEKKEKKAKKEKKEKINESIISSFKIQKAITKVQGACESQINNLIKEDPEKYKNGSDVINAIKSDAFKAYKENVSDKFEDAISVNKWWENFSKSFARLLDLTMFNESINYESHTLNESNDDFYNIIAEEGPIYMRIVDEFRNTNHLFKITMNEDDDPEDEYLYLHAEDRDGFEYDIEIEKSELQKEYEKYGEWNDIITDYVKSEIEDDVQGLMSHGEWEYEEDDDNENW